MRAELRIHPQSYKDAGLESAGGEALTSLKVPASQALAVAKAIKSVLHLAGHEGIHVNQSGDELIDSADVFANVHPGRMIRGLRIKEGITESEFAARLNIAQDLVSELENGRREVSSNMAKIIAEEFKVPCELFMSSQT